MNKKIKIVAAVVATGLVSQVQAANRTWLNNGTDFNTTANWGGGIPGTGDVALFNSAATVQPNLSTSLQIQELNFSTAASSGYTLTSSGPGVTLTLTNTGTGGSSAINSANTSGANLIALPIILGAATGATQTVNQATGATLTITGNITSTNAVTFSKSATGTLILSGTNSWSGNTTVLGGTLSIAKLGSIGSTNSNLGTGSTITLGTGTTVANLTYTGLGETSDRIFDMASSTANITLQNDGGGALILNGNVTSSGSGNKSLVLTGSNGGTINGAIQNGTTSGTIGLNKTGNGTWALGNGSNGFTGAVNITGGVLQLNHSTAVDDNTVTVGIANGLTFNAGLGSATLGGLTGVNGTGNFALQDTAGTPAAIALSIGNNNANTSYSGVMSGSGSVNKIGNGTFTMTGANTYTGSTTVTGGILAINSINNGGSANSPIGSSTSDASNLVLAGGTLQLINATSVQATNRLFTLGVGTGTIDVNPGGGGGINFNNAGNIAYTGSGARTLTLSGPNNTRNGTLSPVLSDGSGGLTSLIKSNANNWTIAGNNSFTGGTTIAGGILQINHANALGTSGTISFTGGTLQYITGVAYTDLSSRFSNAANQAYSVSHAGTSADTITLAADLTSAGGSFTKGGDGKVILGGANSSFNGDLTITKNILSVNGIGMIGENSPAGAGSKINLNGTTQSAILEYTGTGDTTDRTIDLGGTTANGGIISHAGTGLLKFTGNVTASGAITKKFEVASTGTGDGEITGIIADNSSTNLTNFTLGSGGSASGIWTLSGPNTFSGVVTLSRGALSVSSLNSVGTPSASSSLGRPTTAANGIITIGGLGAARLIYTGSGDETTDRAVNIGQNATIEQNGGGLLTFTTDFTQSSAADRTLTLTGTGMGEIAGDLNNNSVTNELKVEKTGIGTWILSGDDNPFTGGVQITNGKLYAGSFKGFGSTTPTINVSSGGTLGIGTDPGVGISAYNVTSPNSSTTNIEVGRYTSGDASTVVDTLGTLKMSNGVVWNVLPGMNITSGTPTLNLSVSLDGNSTGGTVKASGVTVNVSSVSSTVTGSRTMVLGGTTGGNTVGPINNGTATVNLSKIEAGSWTLNNTAGYTGFTSITGGTLTPSVSGAISAGNLTVNGSGATFAMGSTNHGVAQVTVDGGGSITGSGTLTGTSFNVRNGQVDVNLVGASAPLTKTTGVGGNIATLTGANTYSGNTTIFDGTLALTGTASIANTPLVHVNQTGVFDVSGLSSTMTLTSSQTLRGTGTVDGDLIANGTVSPAFDLVVGTLNFADDLTIGGTLVADINGNTPELNNDGTSDFITGIQALNIIGATLTINNLTVDELLLPVAPGDVAYVLASYASLTGTFATVNNLPEGYQVDYNYQNANQIALVAVVPEPSALGLLDVAGLLARRRRRA